MIFLLSAGIPVLVPLGFLNLLSRYLTTRSLLQNNSSRIEGLGEDFSSLSFTLFAVILITCPMVSCWMLTANGYIYDSTGQNVILQMQLPILQNILPELTRELYLPFFIIISIVAFAEYFLYNTLIRFCSFLCGLCYERK